MDSQFTNDAVSTHKGFALLFKTKIIKKVCVLAVHAELPKK
jgi:hypothetical protein